MSNPHDIRRYGSWLFLGAGVVLVGLFLRVSDNIVRQLAMQERQRMELWADATKAIVGTGSPDMQAPADIDLLLRIIRDNTSIPVILTDAGGNILLHRNFQLPEPVDSLNPLYISEANAEWLQRKLDGMTRNPSRVIDIEIAPGEMQRLYYGESSLLKWLALYPYVQLLVLAVFIGVGYYAVTSSKRAEQNKVWVGLSKETAHQLGTPISSLMAWMELLESMGVDPDTVAEMNKDVRRLSTIASRFGKVGSRPRPEQSDLNRVVSEAASYMATRISRRITLKVDLSPAPLPVMVSDSLFQWVIENLVKNAVDAMEAEGTVTVATRRVRDTALLTVTDTGKGIPRKRWKTVFRPGYTTKERGWGLGLALARRIVADYHGGSIAVTSSSPGSGTTFAITLPIFLNEQ